MTAAQSEAGHLAILDLFEKTATKGGKGANKPGKGNSKEDGVVHPTSALQRANDLCTDLLKKGVEAQKLATQIAPLDFCADMVLFLRKFAKAAVRLYKKVWVLVVAQVDEECKYDYYHQLAKPLLESFDKRKKAATTFVNAAKPKKAKAAAEEDGAEGEA